MANITGRPESGRTPLLSSMPREAWAWALYDWGNTAFPTVAASFVLAPYYAMSIAPDPATGQARWAWMQTLSGLAIAAFSPILGAVADAGGRRKAMLFCCMEIIAIASAMLWFARPDPTWSLWALSWFAVGTIAYELSVVFYNSMLPDVAPPERLGLVSGVAWGLGYAGGLGCLLLVLFVLIRPDAAPFGLNPGAAEQIRATGFLVACWTLLFGLPALAMLPKQRSRVASWRESAGLGLRRIRDVLSALPQNPPLARFLLARIFYTDGLNMLFAFGAIYAAGMFAMNAEELLVFGIAFSTSAAGGAAAFGMIDDRVGSKRTVMAALLLLMVLGAGLLVTQEKPIFWGLALALGVFSGPAQAGSRTLMARLAPKEEEATHFGLFALSGRVTGFIGPAVLAAITAATQSQRVGMGTVLLFLVAGGAILATVREPPKERVGEAVMRIRRAPIEH